MLIGAGVAVLLVVAAVLALTLVRVGPARRTELDVNQAQVGVQRVLTDPINGYGRDNVTAVRCNNGRNPTIKRGSGFTCQATVDGRPRQVAVVFADDNGTYAVDRPR